MKGYHYTSWQNWQRIQEEGLKPYPIRNPAICPLFPEGTAGIFTWLQRAEGLTHHGQIMWIMMHHHTTRVVYLSYDFERFETFPGDGRWWEIKHNGKLESSYGEPWVFHRDEPAVLIKVPILPERITVEAVYDFAAMVKRSDAKQYELPRTPRRNASQRPRVQGGMGAPKRLQRQARGVPEREQRSPAR
jgi:hypothetical protein